MGGLAVYQSRGVPSRLPANVLRYANGQNDRAFLTSLSLKQVLNGDLVELGTGDKHRPINLMVWGDSHAVAVTPVIDSLCKEYSVRGVAALHSATAPLVGYENRISDLKKDSLGFSDAVVEFIRKERIGDVLLVAHWGGYGDEGSPARLHRGLLDTINALKDTGARIWIMSEVPKQPWNVPQVLGTVAWRGGDPEELGSPMVEHRKEFQRQDPIFEGLHTRFANVTVLDPTYLFMNSKGLCRVAADGKALYWDDHHLTVAGAMRLRPLFEPIFAKGGEPKSLAGKMR